MATFPSFLSICAIAKNEGSYFQEWIEYHLLIGVEKFYIYDNDSDDDTFEVLKPYIDKGIVEYAKVTGQKMQMPVYSYCFKKCAHETEWLAVIDLDEFIVPIISDNIQTFLKKLPSDVSQVVLPWDIYGSNGHEKRPDGLVIENYIYKIEKSWLYKSILKPRRKLPTEDDPHVFKVRKETIGLFEEGELAPLRNVARINHYHCKSWEEYQLKNIRGDAIDGFSNKYIRGTFDRHDKNEVLDKTIFKYLEKLKERINATK